MSHTALLRLWLTNDRSLYKYARYFAVRHPKIIESEKAIEVVLRLDEHDSVKKPAVAGFVAPGVGRRMTVTAIEVLSPETAGEVAAASDGPQLSVVIPVATL